MHHGDNKVLTLWVVCILVVGLLGVGFLKNYAREVSDASTRSFAVSADGRVSVVPDIAKFSFSVVTEGGMETATVLGENTKKMNAVVAYVRGEGIEAADIKTQQYSLTPRYQYSNCTTPDRACPPPQIVGYSVQQSAEVKVRDFTKLGSLLSGTVSAGANTVSQFTMTIDDTDAYRAQARAQAIEKAKVQAEATAQAAGVKLGRIIGIDESGGGYAPMYRYADTAMGVGGESAMPAAAPSATIEPGSQEVTTSVTLRYELK